MEKWIGRVALVTGASCGIGECIAKELVNYGLIVIGCARSIEKLEKVREDTKKNGGKGKFIPIRSDLTKEEDIIALFNTINEEYGGVDICINNAGVALNAPLCSGNTSDWRTMLDLNVIALSICSREAIKSMKSRGIDDGYIIHINSMSGHRVTPSTSTHFYSATKFAVTALTEGMRNELRQAKSYIRVTSISPGMVDTDFWVPLHDNPAAAEKMRKKTKMLESKDISDAVIYVLSSPKHVQVHDIYIRSIEQQR